ncbi:hypothetical protein SAMN06273572_105166 [Monaibacterium marinum]|uniref:Lipoprotein n=1 Tax=Pontivivens marinum TaxID=1690039 RepID=A0A2C9CTZ6_9RHOB|nr:hypothetical protein SAMN06273572_105166 [Monaibacterium marinum]
MPKLVQNVPAIAFKIAALVAVGALAGCSLI